MANPIDRRRRDWNRFVLTSLGLLAIPAAPAWAALTRTPPQMRGPFYPLQLPLERDNDLTRVDGMVTARGQITDVIGRVIDTDGMPVPDVTIEIWQCNAFGRYHHPHDDATRPLDPGFQGYGHYVTAADGGYRFRTIKPVPYPGRAPHIHFALGGGRVEPLVTQMYVAGAPENEQDFLLRAVRDPLQRARLLVQLEPSGDGLLARFDLVVARR
jgi:protocatechuate 3,4-dioxygenase beta subunit